MRAILIAGLACALLPAAAGETLVSREQALGGLAAPGAAAAGGTLPVSVASAAQQLDGAGGELIVTVVRVDQAHESALIFLSEQAEAGRYRLLARLPTADHAGGAPSQAQILHPCLDQGPGRVWLVRISTPSGGNGGWTQERLLSLRRSGAGAPALDEVDFVSAPQAYQPFLAPGEAVLSAQADDFSATPMSFRFQVWGPHDPHVDPRGGVVTGSYRLSADAGRPGCYRIEAERFDRVAAAPRAER